MSEVSIIGKPQTKVVPLTPTSNRHALQAFFSHHGEETTAVVSKFLEEAFTAYKSTHRWQFLTIKEKAAWEVNYSLLLKLVQSLRL